MTIKSTTSNSPCAKKELPFPKLMCYEKIKSYIILFTSPKEGTVVDQGGGARPIGQHRTDFCPEVFEDFKGSVCLENSTPSSCPEGA